MTPGAEPARPPRELRTRVIAGAVYGALFLGALAVGGFVLGLFLAVLWSLAVWEWARLTGGRMRVLSVVVIGAIPAWVVVALLVAAPDPGTVLKVAWAIALVALMAALAASVIWDWLWWAGLGIGYLAMPAIAAAALLAMPAIGGTEAFWLVAVVWATDVGAFFVGRRFGGSKLAPLISPGKTWSGAIGGLLAAGVVGAVAAGFLFGGLGVGGVLLVGGVAALVSASSQCGDLFESWVKRRFGVKDSGAIIPGHGGILDRIDGLLLATTATVPLGLLLLLAGVSGTGR